MAFESLSLVFTRDIGTRNMSKLKYILFVYIYDCKNNTLLSQKPYCAYFVSCYKACVACEMQNEGGWVSDLISFEGKFSAFNTFG